MLDVSVQQWEYKVVIGSADGSVSVDHARCAVPLAQLLDELAAQGWKLVGQSEALGPAGAHVTYTLRRPAPVLSAEC